MKTTDKVITTSDGRISFKWSAYHSHYGRVPKGIYNYHEIVVYLEFADGSRNGGACFKYTDKDEWNKALSDLRELLK